MKRVLITGANGFIGKHLCEKFEALGCEVFRFLRGRDAADISAFSPAIVIHCAAETRNIDQMMDSNVTLTYNVLEQCRRIDNLESMIYIGSSSEYGRKNHPMRETDSLEPDTVYEATKSCGSMLSRAYARTYGVPTHIVRPFTVYGPREADSRFIPLIYQAYVNKTKIEINEAVHDFIYIDDFIDGILKILFKENKRIYGDAINLGTGIQSPNRAVVDIFGHVVGQKIDYEIVNRPMGKTGIDSMSWVADNRYAYAEYGWYPKVFLHEGIKRYVQYKELNRKIATSV